MREKMSEQPPSTLTASAVGSRLTFMQISRMPWHWNFTQHHCNNWPQGLTKPSKYTKTELEHHWSKQTSLTHITSKTHSSCSYTVKILNIGQPKITTVVVLKWHSLIVQCSNASKDRGRMANTVNPDQTAPSGAVWSGFAEFPQTCLSQYQGIYDRSKHIHDHSLVLKTHRSHCSSLS